MLLQLYPRVHRRYSSLPVFGPFVENFGAWLLKQGYSTDCIREHFCCMRRIARLLHKRGVGSVAELTRVKLLACAPAQRLACAYASRRRGIHPSFRSAIKAIFSPGHGGSHSNFLEVRGVGNTGTNHQSLDQSGVVPGIRSQRARLKSGDGGHGRASNRTTDFTCRSAVLISRSSVIAALIEQSSFC